ncbi:hypothetical protein Bca4012_062486 [Brassica carinata]|uniref:Uncharacterized protein n=1 Tax=Brassica carinata TaxID=52824 RepID=A0A8X7U812_BRACI|nr:hypothetical protein Bca52824_063777 [Brassica carinata]
MDEAWKKESSQSDLKKRLSVNGVAQVQPWKIYLVKWRSGGVVGEASFQEHIKDTCCNDVNGNIFFAAFLIWV